MLHFLHCLERFSLVAFLLSSMLAIGLDLAPKAILAPLRDPRFVLPALGLNFILAPALAWLLTIVIPLESGHAIGLLLLGGAAGAPFIPKLAETARGDAGSAVALMALLTGGTIIFMPFALPWLIPGLKASPWAIAGPLLALIVLPLTAGMLIRSRAPARAARASAVLLKLGNACLLLLFALLLTLNVRALIGVVGSGAIAAVTIYTAGLFASGWMLGGANRSVLGLGTAARNFGAALVPATACFPDSAVTIMIIVGALVALAVLFPAAVWLRRTAVAA